MGNYNCRASIPTVLPNLREVGGYKTADGATVARGLACRSDTFNPMSAEDIKKLERLGLKNDYDLRTTAEVKAKPHICRPGEVAPAECAGRRQVRRAGGTRSAPSPHPWTQRLRRCQSCFPNKELPQHKDFHRQNHPAMPTPLEPGPCS